MKKLFLLLFAFLALTARAWATDVTIGALTVDGFSPTSIGSDRLIAVSTAGGSPTVTSAGLFPTAIVGLSGFTVRIDGANYTVASVASTSSLTLTTNYAGTPGAQTMTLYKWVELRVYADRAFQPLGGTQIVQPGTVGSGNFYRRFAASVVNNGSTDQLFIPSITIPATTDALITNQAKYSFPLYRPGGSQITFFFCPSSLAALALPPATPTTWSAICQFNSPSAVVTPANTAYPKSEIDARLPSCTLNNGVYYSASGNILNCLTFGSGLTLTGGTLTATAGGSGYNQLMEEGANIAQRGILNFIGTAFTATDNAGLTRSELSADPDLNALASIAGTGFAARTAADTWALRSLTQPAAGFTITNPAGVAGNPTFVLANDLAGLEGLGTTGIPARTAADTWAIRTLTQPAAGLTITNPGGVAGNPTFALANDLSALEGLGTSGFAARTAADTWAIRTLTQPAAGLTITNPAGTAGNPTFALANDLSAVEGISATGIVARTAADTWTTRTITGTTGQVTLTNGSGVSGDPTVSLPTTVFLGTAGGSPAAGMLKGPDASGTNIAGANLELAGGPGTGNAIPGQLAARYPLIGASGTTLQSLSADRFPVSTSSYTNTTIGTAVANTTTETSLFTGATASAGSTRIIEAGLARAGTMFRLRFYLLFSTTGTPTIQFRLKLGSTTVCDSTAFNAPTGVASGLAYLDVFIFVNAIGSSGLVRGQMEGRIHSGLGGAVTPVFFSGPAGEPTIDFTINETIDLTVQWGTASASNSAQLLSALIHRIR